MTWESLATRPDATSRPYTRTNPGVRGGVAAVPPLVDPDNPGSTPGAAGVAPKHFEDGEHVVDSQPEIRAAMRTAIAASAWDDAPPAGSAEGMPAEETPGFAPASVPAETCDVCRAADLAASGVMASSVAPETLHLRCRAPGSCTCGCPTSQGGRCQVCGRNRALEELAAGACSDPAECAEVLLVLRPPSAPVRTSAKATSAAPRPPRAPRAPGGSGSKPCTCGCGGATGGGNYLPGHDSKHLAAMVAGVRAGGVTLVAALEQLPSEALRDKLSKRLETK